LRKRKEKAENKTSGIANFKRKQKTHLQASRETEINGCKED